LGIAMVLLVNPILVWKTQREGPKMPTEIILTLGAGMIGLRSWEKGRGVEGNH